MAPPATAGELGLDLEPVARLDLDRRYAFAGEGLQPRQRSGVELLFARGSGRAHGGEDAATFGGDVLVADALLPPLERAGVTQRPSSERVDAAASSGSSGVGPIQAILPLLMAIAPSSITP